MNRLPGWRTLLLDWSAEMLGKPFAWGETDCASLGRAALKVMFGRDLLPKAAQWKTEHAAAKRIATTGGPAQVMRDLGAQQFALAFIRSGDIIVTEEIAEPVGGIMVVVCLDGAVGLGCSRESGVAFVDCTRLPHDSRAYSLWEAHG